MLAPQHQSRSSAAAIAAVLLPALLWLAFEHGGLWRWLASLDFCLFALLQADGLLALWKQRGSLTAAAALPRLFWQELLRAASAPLRWARAELHQDRWLPLAAAFSVLLVFGVFQVAGGAYQAEFDGYSDEASHFMTGLVLRDYAVTWPLPAPRPWAEQYYLHYPRVALGHWPPLFHLVEAGWWLFVPPSRESAMFLIGVLAACSALLFYRLARRVAPAHWALAAVFLFVGTPVIQHATARVMAEQLSLVLGLLFLERVAAFVRSGSRTDAARLTLLIVLSLLVKGTGLALVPVPLAALYLAGRRRGVNLALIALAAAGVAIATLSGWYMVRSGSLGEMLIWAGISGGYPFTLAPLAQSAGTGMVAAAAIGFLLQWKERDPLAASCAAVILSTAAAALVFRAMNEPRHWIAMLPALFLLALQALTGAQRTVGRIRRWSVTAGLAVLILAPYPWLFYRQESTGVARVAASIARPARILVTAQNPRREGIWIPAVSAGESRPSSIVVRSTRSVAYEGFQGKRYSLILQSAEEVSAWLDRYGIDTVVVDEVRPEVPGPAHHALVRQAVQTRPAWRACAHGDGITAYCRTEPPPKPAEKLQIEILKGYTVRER